MRLDVKVDDTSGTHPHVVPTHFKSKFSADDTLVLGFAPFTLDKGVCYTLKFAPSKNWGEISLASMIVPDMIEYLDLTVCTSSCECDFLGTKDC